MRVSGRLLGRARSLVPKKTAAVVLALAAVGACAEHQQSAESARAVHPLDFRLRPTADQIDEQTFGAVGADELPTPLPPAEIPRCLDFAKEAARWLRGAAIETKDGLAWPADPNDPKSVETSLYAGSAGVVLFFLELHRATHDPKDLETARRGADALAASLPQWLGGEGAGLYTGVAGVGFTLFETARETDDPKYRDAANRVVDLLAKEAKAAYSGLEWNENHDIVSGAAGTGLFLLYAAREMGRADALALARRAGDCLLDVGIPERGGLKWGLDPSYKRFLPNFSHGTAGVAYFLARLHAATKDPKYLDGAVAGAEYLLAVGDTSSGTFRVFHADPDGLDRYYLGWCHGPAGTGRLFFELWRSTGDWRWRNWMTRARDALLKSGIPESRPNGFWNNVGICCGSAGIADFVGALARTQRRIDASNGDIGQVYLDVGISWSFERRLTADLLARGLHDDRGLRWPHAEHRVRPELVIAQTGYMQGAAGIGVWLLRVSAPEERAIRLPDDPFARW
jgi:lanthionine synthetase-like protein